MRIIGRSPVLLLLLCGLLTAAPPTTLSALADLASDLSQGDPVSAIAIFDPQVPHYAEISDDIVALAAQTDVSCAIDIVSDTETEGVHKLDLDWLMQIKSRDDAGALEQRRVRVQVGMKLVKGKWKIIAFSPLTVLDPIHVH